jgi:hypothetical protein
MKIKLTIDQSLSLYNFLKETAPIEPTNFIEWGKDWMKARYIFNKFHCFYKNGILEISEPEYWALFNMLAMYVDQIKEAQKGEKLFNEMRDLFICYHSQIGLRIPACIFCYMDYNGKPRFRKIPNPLNK